MKTWWETLDGKGRIGLAGGAALILLAMLAGGWWLQRAERAVLFSDLKPQDAALMAAELDRQKLDYAVADDGSTLLVNKAEVHATRLKLMGRDLPLHGAVGLELFNNTDFGMTEFAQKINYQRALQGELTRTILSFEEIRDARVHLALPEQGLFKQAATRPKAAVTLTLRQGRALRGEQVHGIQRLVAAAVSGLSAQEVTIVNHQGVALSRTGGDAEAVSGDRLDLKRETEGYLSRKAGVVLERAFGPGQAIASVDVTLNMDQVSVTTEDVIAAPEGRGGIATGVLVRERESARDSATPDADARGARGSSMQRDVEYQAGRRVEQVVSRPGSIRRIHVVAVVRQGLDAQQQQQVRELVAAAVGASTARGDAVVVQSFAAAVDAGEAVASAMPAPVPAQQRHAGSSMFWGASPSWLALLLVFPAALALWTWGRRLRPPSPVLALTENQRQAALRRVEAWLHEEQTSTAGGDVLIGSGGGTSP